MQRRQGVCASAASRSLSQLAALRSPFQWIVTRSRSRDKSAVAVARSLAVVLTLSLLLCAAIASAQVNTATLSGTVLDPSGGAIRDAKVTLSNAATGAERTSVSDDNGRYNLVGLPPGQYKMTVDGGPGFAAYENTAIVLTVGEAATLDAQLQMRGQEQSVVVTSEAALVETQKSDVSSTIDSHQITNLPINERNYINFTLLDSQSARDDTPSIGAAPTTGLNFGGQRARSNEVSVDGADAVDKSVGGVRATVSQEAVQEFQVITSNYMPEYGRAMGGVVNIVTKSGSNQVHGNVFGFLRATAIQARDPFSVQGSFNPATDSVTLTPVKQSYTRAQAGVTLGGPIVKDKTFYFFSYETIRAQANGFTSIGQNNFDLVPVPGASVCSSTPLLLTGGTNGQAAFYPAKIAAAGGCGSAAAVPFIKGAALSGGASAVALFGNTGALPAPLNSFPEDGAACGGPCPLPPSFHGLVSLLGNYPTREGTSLWSLRLDQNWNTRNATSIRASVTPSLVTGIQVNAQNQNFGQNAASRTSQQQTRDLAIVGQQTTAIGNALFNEFRFQFARRGLHYGFSTFPGGSDPAVNLTGFAFFGREPFTTEDRVERRFQWTDNLSWTKGGHTFKFGADVNLVKINTNASQIFTLNYGGVYTFGSLDPTQLVQSPLQLPSLNSVQAYGLGIPTTYFQGIGNSNRPTTDKSLGVFAQDSWKINRKLTLNYGVRYDIEWTPIFPPAPGTLNPAASQALGVIQGIPLNSKNVQPRVGLAWDPWGNGKTVIRAGYGIFYDNPSLALGFLANAFDGAESTLLLAAGGTPCVLQPLQPCSVDTNPQALNATNIFQGLLTGALAGCSTAFPSMCYQKSQQRFNSFQPNSLFVNQNFLKFPPAPSPVPPTGPFGAGYPLLLLPFTIPVDKNFKFGYAQQSNLTIEREITKDWKITAAYNYTHGVHLDRTRNINVTNPALLVSNDSRAVAAGLVDPGTNPLGVSVPTPSQINTLCGGVVPAFNVPSPNALGNQGSIAFATPTGTPLIPGVLGYAYSGQNCTGTKIGFIGTPAVFNFFRPSGPNPSFGGLVPGGYATLVGLAQAAGFLAPGTGTVPIPWSDVQPQTSTGNSVYHAFTLTVTKRFSHGVELLSGWTYSHTIDDSTDLSTLLNPQNNNNPNGERGNSDFDQRHRWITSAVFLSPYHQSDPGFAKKFFADFTVAPIFEVASGRPYNILLGFDTNLDLGTGTNRPDVFPSGKVPAGLPVVNSPFVKGFDFTIPTVCLGPTNQPFPPDRFVPSPPVGCVGNLARNAFNRPLFFQIDLRVARKFAITERFNLEVIADGFNMLNRFNVSDVSPLCDTTSGACNAGQPSAARDPRTFQFALKLNW